MKWWMKTANSFKQHPLSRGKSCQKTTLIEGDWVKPVMILVEGERADKEARVIKTIVNPKGLLSLYQRNCLSLLQYKTSLPEG